MKIKTFILTVVVSLSILSCSKVDVDQSQTKTQQTEIKSKRLKEKIIQSTINSAARNAGVIDWEEVYDELSESLSGVFGFSTYRFFFTDYTNGRFQGAYRPSMITNGLDVIVNNTNALELSLFVIR